MTVEYVAGTRDHCHGDSLLPWAPSDDLYFALSRCGGLDSEPYYVRLPSNTIIRAARYQGCREVIHPGFLILPQGGIIVEPTETFAGTTEDGCNLFPAEDCPALYTLVDCDGVEADIVTSNDLSADVGGVIKIDTNAGRCRGVLQGGGGSGVEVTVLSTHETCTPCIVAYKLEECEEVDNDPPGGGDDEFYQLIPCPLQPGSPQPFFTDDDLSDYINEVIERASDGIFYTVVLAIYHDATVVEAVGTFTGHANCSAYVPPTPTEDEIVVNSVAEAKTAMASGDYDVVTLVAGTHNAGSGAITVPAGVTFRGQGIGSTIIEFTSQTNTGVNLHGTMSDLMIDCTDIQSAGMQAVYLRRSGTHLLRCEIRGATSNGLGAQNITNWSVKDCIFRDCARNFNHQIYCQGPISNGVIARCHFYGTDAEYAIKFRCSLDGTGKLEDLDILGNVVHDQTNYDECARLDNPPKVRFNEDIRVAGNVHVAGNPFAVYDCTRVTCDNAVKVGNCADVTRISAAAAAALVAAA